MKLFEALPKLGLTHRVVMAPCTRIRGVVPSDMHVKYYTQRASPGGLIITEGSPITKETQYESAAGIYTQEQEDGWKKVTDSVHKKGGKISIQLWHLGRMNHESWIGGPPVSSSNQRAPGETRTTAGKKEKYSQPRPLTKDELYGKILEDYTNAALAAKRCNFDYIEIHGAHGYLLDQFLADEVNLRDDEFGAQSFENRTRLMSMVIKACIKAFDGDSQRVAIRISPVFKDSFAYQGCKDSNPDVLYREVVAWLDQFSLGYLLLTEPRWNGGHRNWDPRTDPSYNMPMRITWAKEKYRGIIIGSGGFTPQTGEEALKNGYFDMIAYGRLFIGNPDLPERIRTGSKLNVYQTGLFYSPGEKGYIDYPNLEGTISPVGNYESMEAREIGINAPKSDDSKL